MCTNEQHLPMHNGNAISHRLTSYQSCSGLGWGRCGAYNAPEQRRKATVQTDGGCCWPSAVPGPVEAETPSCSGWDWRGGWGRMRAAAAVAAGMLWLVDYHCSEWWRRIEEDISWACVQTTGSTSVSGYIFPFCFLILWNKDRPKKFKHVKLHSIITTARPLCLCKFVERSFHKHSSWELPSPQSAKCCNVLRTWSPVNCSLTPWPSIGRRK